MQQGTGFDGSLPLGDGIPEPKQEQHVRSQSRFIDALGGGSRDKAAGAMLLLEGIDAGPQPATLGLALNSLGHPANSRLWHVNQKHRGNGQFGGQPGALGANGVLDHLYDQFLPVAQDPLDLVVLGLFAFGGTQIGDVQEGGAFKTDVDESRLHAGQDAANLALVDIADQPPAPGALDQHFLQYAVLDDRHPGLRGRDVDQDFVTHACVFAAFGREAPGQRGSEARLFHAGASP